MSIASPAPTPREVFGADAHRAVRLYEEAISSVLEQCKNRLRRGDAPSLVTVLLRTQYVTRLAPLAAGVEILQDAVLDESLDEAALKRHEQQNRALRILGDEVAPTAGSTLQQAQANVPVGGMVRYSPFGNAAPRPASRKKAQA